MNQISLQVRPPSETRRILFLNDLCFQYGAGIAQARQIQSLLDAGHEVAVMSWEPGGIEFEQVTTKPVDGRLWRGLNKVRHLETSATMSDDAVIAGLVLQAARFAPDVVIAGNLHGANWSLRLLPALREIGCRVIAYLHDGYLFSGRCAYPGACTLYLTGCNETCPTAHEYPALDPKLIAGQWELRRRIFNGPDGIEVVANSHWTRDVFRAALPLCRSCETVYLAADENVFKPGDKHAARRQLLLPLDKPVVLCAAVNFQDRRKGGHFLREIISALKDSVTFAAFGHNAAEIPGLIGLGYHTNAQMLAQIYQAADIFLGTAIEEAFGQTVMEAQLCGLPVVAFQVGGIMEIVRNEITGKLVRVSDSAGSVAAINAYLADDRFRCLTGAWARQSVMNRFSLAAQARGWVDYLSDHTPRGVGYNPPDQFTDATVVSNEQTYQPSWSGPAGTLSNEHAGIFEATASLCGALTESAALKLYEMGYHAGDVILAVGAQGRPAVAALRGALANPARTLPPQYFGLTQTPATLGNTRQALVEAGVIDCCHLFTGSLQDFRNRWRVEPTVVSVGVDGDDPLTAATLTALAQGLRPGVPVLVHDAQDTGTNTASNARRRAIQEWISDGGARLLGYFGDAALCAIASGQNRLALHAAAMS